MKAQLSSQLDKGSPWAGEALGVAVAHTSRWTPQTLGQHLTLTAEDVEPVKGCSTWGRANRNSQGEHIPAWAAPLASSGPNPAAGLVLTGELNCWERWFWQTYLPTLGGLGISILSDTGSPHSWWQWGACTLTPHPHWPGWSWPSDARRRQL